MKRFLKIAFFLLVVVALSCAVSAESGDTIVYVTSSGEKYHNSDCEYLGNSRNEISLSTAINLGYEPCSQCNAPSISVRDRANSWMNAVVRAENAEYREETLKEELAKKAETEELLRSQINALQTDLQSSEAQLLICRSLLLALSLLIIILLICILLRFKRKSRKQ